MFSIVLTTRRDIEALKPLFKVSDKDAEIIIIDTNYNQKTLEELNKIEHDYVRVIYAPPIKITQQIGETTEIKYKRDLVRCHNTGFAYADEEWIMKVDDCTEFKPDFFDRLRENINTQWAKKDDVVFRPVKLEEWTGHKKWEQYPILTRMNIPREQRYIRLGREGLGNGMFITLDQALFKHSAILKLNGNDERYDIGHGYEDIDLMQRFITLGYNIILDQELMTFQKKHMVKADPFDFSRLLYEFTKVEIINGRYRAYNPYDIAGLKINKEKYTIHDNPFEKHSPNWFTGEYPFNEYFNKEQLMINTNRIMYLKNKHEGEDLFILGNSPDITKEFIEKIRGKTTFAANGFLVMKDIWEYQPTYMVITNQGTFDNHLRNMKPEFKQYEGGSVSDLFLEAKCDFVFSDLILKPLFILQRKQINHAERRIKLCNDHCHIQILNKEEFTYPFMIKSKPTEQDINFNLLKGTYMCGTVITDLMLPLAAWMGFKNIYLKGCSGGAGHFYDISPRHFWDGNHQTEIYHDLYALFKKLLSEKNINIYNLDKPTEQDYDDEEKSKQIENPTKHDGHYWDGPIYHHTLGKQPHIIEYKPFEEIL